MVSFEDRVPDFVNTQAGLELYLLHMALDPFWHDKVQTTMIESTPISNNPEFNIHMMEFTSYNNLSSLIVNPNNSQQNKQNAATEVYKSLRSFNLHFLERNTY